MNKNIIIALVGQPNVGKSLLVNAICGSSMKVGNFPGVTIEKAQASINYNGYTINFIDLPGTYSLNGYSEEEKITRSFLDNEKYDLIINVADSTNLERNLLLSAQILEMQKKMVLALNMSDEAQKEGININYKELSSLLAIPVIPVSAYKKQNLNTLLDACIALFEQKITTNKRIYSNEIETEILKIEEFLKAKNNDSLKTLNLSFRQIAILLLKQDEELFKFLHAKPIYMELTPLLQESLNNLYIVYNTKSTQEIFLSDLYAFSKGLVAESISYKNAQKESMTQKIDKILINKYTGIPIFLFFMWLLFWLTFSFGEIPQTYIEDFFTYLSDTLKEIIPNELLASVICDGIIGGVGAVLSFLPNIIIVFFGIALLETTGYMARVAFLLDGLFHKFGLHGKSFIPLVTGFGCSVPAFMATRTLKSKKDKLLTLFIINFMSCSARLPVYVLFVGAFFTADKAGNYLFAIYLFGALLGLVMAKILRVFVFKEADDPFVMEMPKYRIPSWHLVWFSVYNKAMMYVKKAGTYILAASVLVWFLSNFPMQNEDKNLQNLATNTQISQEFLQNSNIEDKKDDIEVKSFENSYLATIGKFIEPVFMPLGFDWKMSVALVSGLSAKEIFISTLGVLYSLDGEVDEENEDLRTKLKNEIPFATAISLILFVMFYNPCLAATIVFKNEAGGAKYAVYLFIFTTCVAYIAALIGGIIARSLI